MKKFALAALVALIAASPAAAQEKKKAKKQAAPAASSVQNNNQNSLNFAKDSLPIFLPSWSMPAYMAVNGDEQRKK
jgi:hypothetical protein